MDVLYEEFGLLEEIADVFFNWKDYGELLRKTKTRVARWKIVNALVTVILLVAIVFIVSVIRDSAGTFTVTKIMGFLPHAQAQATLKPSMMINGPSLTVPTKDPGILHTAKDTMHRINSLLR